MLPSKINTGHSADDEQPGSPLAQVFQEVLHDGDADALIFAIIGLEGTVDKSNLIKTLQEKVAPLKRFRSTMKWSRGKFVWYPVHVDVTEHVHEVQCPENMLQNPEDFPIEYCNRISGQSLDRAKPQWDIHILRGGSDSGKGDCLLFRFNHSIGDGVSLTSLFLDLVNTKDGSAPTLPGRKSIPPSTIWQTLLYFWHTLVAMNRFNALLVWPDPVTHFKATTCLRHHPREVSARKYLLSDVKAVAKVCGSTVNDVLLAATAGAIQRIKSQQTASKESKGFHTAPGTQIRSRYRPRATMIVNVRPPLSKEEMESMRRGEENEKWGTIVGYVNVPLPADSTTSPLQKVHEVKGFVDRVKGSWEPMLVHFGMAYICRLLGAKTLLRFLWFVLAHTTLGISNIVGPSEEIWFSGHRVLSLQQFVLASPQGISVHISSLSGTIFICATTCPTLVRSREVMDGFDAAIMELKEAASSSCGIRDTPPG